MKIIDTKPFSTAHECNEIVNIPLYKICKVEQIVNLSNYKNIIFQSPSAVLNFDKIALLESKRIIAMGPGTSDQLRKHSYIAEIPDTEYSSEGIINLLNKSVHKEFNYSYYQTIQTGGCSRSTNRFGGKGYDGN